MLLVTHSIFSLDWVASVYMYNKMVFYLSICEFTRLSHIAYMHVVCLLVSLFVFFVVVSVHFCVCDLSAVIIVCSATLNMIQVKQRQSLFEHLKQLLEASTTIDFLLHDIIV